MRSLELVYKAIDEVNAQNPDAPQIEKGPETALLEEGSGVDSLALVNLVVAIEQVVYDETGESISVAEESVVSSTDSPFRTVGTLADHLERLIAKVA